MEIVFICPSFNAASNMRALVRSIAEQNASNYKCVIIDDMSTDKTADAARAAIQELPEQKRPFFVVQENESRQFALKNIIDVARSYQDRDDVAIAVVDGDDELCNSDAVNLLTNAYESGNEVVWTAHRWDINGMNISKAMPANVDPYQWPWSTSHLRTFKSSLLSKISDANFQDHKGNWFKRGYDQALMLPLLHLTTKRKFIDKVCYLYKIDSASIPATERNWSEKQQLSTIGLVRARGFLK